MDGTAGGSPRIVTEQVGVDSLLLCNSVETRDGLLFLMGGGWTRCWPLNGQLPFEKIVPIALVFRVPYTETNQDHQFTVSLRDSDENEIADRANGAFKIGRPVDLTDGMSQLVSLGLAPPITFERTGIYHVVVEVNGEERKRVAFEVLPRTPKSN